MNAIVCLFVIARSVFNVLLPTTSRKL